MTLIHAPFTAEQVDSLNGYQISGIMHPFTCGGDDCRSDLIATEKGWICENCSYTQDWAHDFMANGSWKNGLNWHEQLEKQISRSKKIHRNKFYRKWYRWLFNLCEGCGCKADRDWTLRWCENCIDDYCPKNGITKMKNFKEVRRWLFRRCIDCNVKLDKNYNRGDVCDKCFDEFNGATIEEIMKS